MMEFKRIVVNRIVSLPVLKSEPTELTEIK